MKTKVLLSVAGLAACGASDAQVRPELQTAQFSGQVHQAVRATAITGLTVDGRLSLLTPTATAWISIRSALIWPRTA